MPNKRKVFILSNLVFVLLWKHLPQPKVWRRCVFLSTSVVIVVWTKRLKSDLSTCRNYVQIVVAYTKRIVYLYKKRFLCWWNNCGRTKDHTKKDEVQSRVCSTKCLCYSVAILLHPSCLNTVVPSPGSYDSLATLKVLFSEEFQFIQLPSCKDYIVLIISRIVENVLWFLQRRTSLMLCNIHCYR